MYRNIRQAMAAMFGLALTAAFSFQAAAQDDAMLDVDQSEPMAEVADSYGKDCGKGCCDDVCCGSGSFYGEFQFLYLEAYGTEDDINPDVDEEEGYRLVGGYQGCDGLGLRVRYFDFDGVQEIGGGEEGLDLSYFDLEVTDVISICNLHGLVSAGYRHGELDQFDDGLSSSFEGDGITLGVQLQRDLGCNLGLFAWAQHSILFGDDDENDREDMLMSWTEIQLGAQYCTCVGGYNTVVRGGVEVQRHEGVNDGDTADSGLFGWFLSAGVNF